MATNELGQSQEHGQTLGSSPDAFPGALARSEVLGVASSPSSGHTPSEVLHIHPTPLQAYLGSLSPAEFESLGCFRAQCPLLSPAPSSSWQGLEEARRPHGYSSTVLKQAPVLLFSEPSL